MGVALLVIDWSVDVYNFWSMKTKKTINSIVGANENSFEIIRVFKDHAKKHNLSDTEVTKICNEAMSGDYYNMVWTLAKYCNLK